MTDALAPVTEALGLAMTSLLTVPVLMFVVGVIAGRISPQLRLPDAAYRLVSMYLLLAIGLKGGTAMREAGVGSAVLPASAAVALGLAVPLIAYGLLRLMTRLSGVDRGAMAAHYGSTSLVTFVTAIVFLESSGIEVAGYSATLLTIMEIPGIVVGIFLARRSMAGTSEWGSVLREVLFSPSVVLLVAGLGVGLLVGPSGYAPVEPFFTGLFPGVLAIFLLHMGTVVGSSLHSLREFRPGLLAFAIGFPFLAGGLGLATGLLLGLSVGGVVVLAVLCASASYIAAPAAVRLAVPEANVPLCLTASLTVTFPVNLVVGIPVYTALAEALA